MLMPERLLAVMRELEDIHRREAVLVVERGQLVQQMVRTVGWKPTARNPQRILVAALADDRPGAAAWARLMNWLRWYVGTCVDAKLHKASRLAKTRRSVAIAAWAAILEEARRNSDAGQIDEIDSSWLAQQIDERPTTCQRVIDAFKGVHLINSRYVENFKKRQFCSDHSTPRVQKHRAKKLNALDSGAAGNVTETRRKRTRTESKKNLLVIRLKSPTHHRGEFVPLGALASACVSRTLRAPDQHASPEPTEPPAKPNGLHGPASPEMTPAEAESDLVRRREEFLRALEESERGSAE